MEYIFILSFAATLVYFALFERVKKFIYLVALQGILLFGIAFINLIHIDLLELILILLETIVVKTVIIPVFLRRLTRHNHLKRMHEVAVPVFYSIIYATLIIAGSFVLSHYLVAQHIQTKYFTVAFAAVVFGIYFIIIHKNIFSHLIGYLIIENGIFLFSIAIGSQMPILIGLAILLDVLVGVLAIGVFVNKVGDTFRSTDINELTHLKD